MIVKRISERYMCTLVSLCIFTAAAFVGPLIRFIVWPPSRIGEIASFRVDRFIYDLIFLLWPTQSLAVMEVNVGTPMAITVAIGSNILLYATTGIVAGLVSGRRIALLTIYLLVCVLVTLFALWGAGSDLAFVNVIALALALVFYAIPFWVVTGLGQRVDSSLG